MVLFQHFELSGVRIFPVILILGMNDLEVTIWPDGSSL